MKQKRIKVIRRQATLDDVLAIDALDKKVWPEFPGTPEMFASRIKTFPEGNFVALHEGKIIGYLGVQLVHFDTEKTKPFTWSEISDAGTIVRSHSYSGNYMYGIAMSVDPEYQGCGVGTKLALNGWAVQIRFNVEGCLIGSQIPDYHKYCKDVPIDQYVALKKGKYFVDHELRMWQKEGYYPMMILPNYINDPKSLNFGVLVGRKNPFRYWPFRRSLATLFEVLGPQIIRSSF